MANQQVPLLVLKNSHSPKSYDLKLKIDHSKANFNGSLVINLSRSGTSSITANDDFIFHLHSSELVILSAHVQSANGTRHKTKVIYDRPTEQARLVVEKMGHLLYKEDSLTVEVQYIGKVNTTKTFQDATRGIFKTNYMDDRANDSTNYIIATHCQPSFARTIFPCIDEPSSKAIFKLSITTHSRFKIISNTSPELKELDEQSQLQTISFQQTPIMASSIFGFVIGDLDFIESTVSLSPSINIPIRVYTAIGSITGAAYCLDIASKCLPFISQLLECPYPLDKLDIVALPFLSDGAMENHGLITIQSTHVLIDSLGDKLATRSIRQLIAHEIIHHWIGNTVSFDEWDHLWLNESFATWFAYYALDQMKLDPLDSEIWMDQVDVDIETLFNDNSHVRAQPIISTSNANQGKLIKSTHDAFEVNSYQKGIQFLRMLSNVFESSSANDHSGSSFIKAIGEFVNTNDNTKPIKPSDLWKFLHEKSSLDLLAFTHSWLRLPGFPLVSVSINNDNKIELEQHRYLDDTTVEKEQLEDVPFHIPLLIHLKDGSVINMVMNDRKLVLQDIEVDEFVKLNTNRVGVYRVDYRNFKLVNNIVANVDSLTSLDIIGLLHDLTTLNGHEFLHSDLVVISILKLSEKLIDSGNKDYRVLKNALTALEVIENNFKLYSIDQAKYLKFHQWLLNLNTKLYHSFTWDDDSYSKSTNDELECRRSILNLGLQSPECSQTSNQLFKKLIHGPAHSVPSPLLAPILSTVSHTASQSTWKKILELVKHPGLTINNISHTTNPVNDIQHAAIRSLGYAKDPMIVKRVLNFVTTNIDTAMIELGLVGLLYNNTMNKGVLWDWYKLNYDTWAARSTRSGTQSADQLRKTLRNVSMIVLSGMTEGDKDQEVVQRFVKAKLAKLPKHGLEEVVKEVQLAHEEKLRIAGSIDNVLLYI